MKPSMAAVYLYMIRRGEFVTSADIVRDCYTVTPSKRLDELHDAGLIVKEKLKGRTMKYRAKTLEEIQGRKSCA